MKKGLEEKYNSMVDLRGKSWSRAHTPSVMARSMFYYILSGGYFYCDKEYKTEREDYDRALLIYTIGGKGYLKYREQSYTLTGGDLFLIDCNRYQYYATDKKDLWEMAWFHFDGSETGTYLERIYQNAGPVYRITVDSDVVGNIKKIHKMLNNNDPLLDVMGSCLIVQILTEILILSRHGRIQNNNDQSNIPDIPVEIKKVIEKIEQDYNLSLTLDILSSEAGLSKYHLSREFKKYTGYSPYEYLINYRLSRAKDLLKNTNTAVGRIASEVGFNSPSHFIELFSRHEDTTPLNFRKFWR